MISFVLILPANDNRADKSRYNLSAMCNSHLLQLTGKSVWWRGSTVIISICRFVRFQMFCNSTFLRSVRGQTASGSRLVNFAQISLSHQTTFQPFSPSVQLGAQSGQRSKVGEFCKLFLKKVEPQKTCGLATAPLKHISVFAMFAVQVLKENG